MNSKNVGMIFALRVFSVGNRVNIKFGDWPIDCPNWLRDMMDTLLSEYDNSKMEIGKLLQAFVDAENYEQLKVSLEKEVWVIDAFGR